MCRDRDSTIGTSVPPAGVDANASRRLPPPAMWLARASLAVGVIFILRSLPMSADYNYWNYTPYPTYDGIFLMTLFFSNLFSHDSTGALVLRRPAHVRDQCTPPQGVLAGSRPRRTSLCELGSIHTCSPMVGYIFPPALRISRICYRLYVNVL